MNVNLLNLRLRMMRPTLIICSLLVLSGCSTALEQRFQSHIDYLASDELQGRRVGTEGLELAAKYIEAQYKEIGLRPAGDDGSFFQSFPITLARKLTENSYLTVATDSTPRQLKKDFVPFPFSSNQSFEGDVIFCGYGITATDKQHDDFVHVDAKDKIILMLRGKPADWSDEGGFMRDYGSFRNKIYNAKDRGAVAVLIVNQAPLSGHDGKLFDFDQHGASDYGIPAFHVSRAYAQTMLKLGGADSLEELQRRNDTSSYVSAALTNVKVSGHAAIEKKKAPTQNVVGLLSGSGPLKDEYVVIGAHYDHLGLTRPMMRKFKDGKIVREKSTPQIHNGADDNASGVSGLIEIARALSEKKGPRRGVLFVAFSAEETGLHGSNYYVKHPLVPQPDTVAMLNLDMIGRMPVNGNILEVFGANSGDTFEAYLTKAAKPLGIKIAPSPDTGGRSDHAPFVREKVPSMHFFTGQHSDYHKPTDDAYKINAPAGAKVIRLVSQVASDLASSPSRPKFQEVDQAKLPSPGGTPTYRVVMGLAPGYGDDGSEGMKVEAVNPQGPADIAGIKAGDRIISIDGKKVANIYDYMASTRSNNPGDTVDVVVVRDGREISIKVTLSGAG